MNYTIEAIVLYIFIHFTSKYLSDFQKVTTPNVRIHSKKERVYKRRSYCGLLRNPFDV